MTLEPCARCHRPGSIGNPELRATLCHSCDQRFLEWWAGADDYAHATDWPGWVGGAA